MYDNDKAGLEGIEKSLEKNNTYGEVSINAITSILGVNDDVDSWVKNHDTKTIIEYINKF
jgi:DNA primase